MAISLLALAAFAFNGNACAQTEQHSGQSLNIVQASDPQISYSGRVLFHSGSVSFDWTGVHATFKFTGGYCAVKLSDTGRDYYRILNEDIPVCPQCGTVLSGYDNRKRHAIDDFGNKQWYRLRRLKCRPCKKLHLEIPDFIQPQKHYEKGVISNALRGNTC